MTSYHYSYYHKYRLTVCKDIADSRSGVEMHVRSVCASSSISSVTLVVFLVVLVLLLVLVLVLVLVLLLVLSPVVVSGLLS